MPAATSCNSMHISWHWMQALDMDLVPVMRNPSYTSSRQKQYPMWLLPNRAGHGGQ